MPYTAPATNPLLFCQRSRMYCESARCGSIARTAAMGHSAIAPAASARRQSLWLRKKDELLNHHLDGLRGRPHGGAIVEERQIRALGAGVGHARGEEPLRDDAAVRRAGAASGRERHASRLPAERVRDEAGGNREA